MPRDLADVLHYFLPEISDELVPAESPTLNTNETPGTGVGRIRPPEVAGASSPGLAPCLPILGLPIGENDVVRAALAWNLAIETSRLGGATVIVTPDSDSSSPLWPEAGAGPLGTELFFCPAVDLQGLYSVAHEIAADHARRGRRGGIVFVRIPPAWLVGSDPETNPIRWLLLLTSANRRDLTDAFDLAKTLAAVDPHVEIGVTVHGVRSISEARNAFEYLSRLGKQELGMVLASYGLLVDDLHVYRAIAAQRPIGVAHPQAPATRALMDVARLLYEDARSRVLG